MNTKTAKAPAKAAGKPTPAAKSTQPPKPKPNAYAGLASMLSAGLDTNLMSGAATQQMFKLSDIEVEPQVREEFEDDENTLQDLASSLKVRQLQPILLRKNRPGRTKPYLLVVGGRRTMAAPLAGLTELWGYYDPDMTDEQAEEFQLAENIQRKNLTQIEEAKRVQEDLDKLNGDVDAVLKKHNKSRPWLSKILGLLNLSDQAKRLLTEKVSADLEVINIVKQVEKVDPKQAGKLVDELKASRGKANAREKAQAVKDKVKPSKKGAAGKADKGDASTQTQEDIFADAKISPTPDSGKAEPVTNGADKGTPAAEQRAPATPRQALSAAYQAVYEANSKPATVIERMSDAEREAVTEHLRAFYEAGKQSKDAGRAVMQGLRAGQFATDGDGALALVSFLHGADQHANFNLLNVLGAVKA